MAKTAIRIALSFTAWSIAATLVPPHAGLVSGPTLRGGCCAVRPGPQSRAMATTCARSKLLVLDFDWTVINSNSDTDVVEAFTDDVPACRARLKAAGQSNAWTAGMDAEMRKIHEQGVSKQQVEDFLHSIKIEPELSDALKLAHANGVIIHILSDANTWFIDVILRANGLLSCITHVCSNPCTVEASGRIRVLPYHTTPHPAGSTSPPNLCKGRVMEQWLQESGAVHEVFYAGDGAGDYEGAIRVPRGVIFARKNWSLHKRLSAAGADGRGPVAEVRTWDTQAELAKLILAAVGLPPETLAH